MTCQRCGREEPTFAASLIDSAATDDDGSSCCQCQSRSMRCRSGPFNIERIVAGNSWPRAYRIATTTTTEIFDYPSLPDHTHSCIDFARLVGKRTVSTSSSLRAQENIRKTSREVKKEALVKKRLVSDSSAVSPTKHNKGIDVPRGTHYEAHDAGPSGCSASPHTSSSLDPDPEEVSPSGSHTSSPRRRQIAQARSTPKLVLRKRATDTDTAIIRVANGSHEQTLNEAFFGLQLDETDRKGAKVLASQIPATHTLSTTVEDEPKPGPLPPTSEFDPMLRSAERKYWPREWLPTSRSKQEKSTESPVSRKLKLRASSPSPSICAMMIPPSPIMYSRKSSLSQEDFALL